MLRTRGGLRSWRYAALLQEEVSACSGWVRRDGNASEASRGLRASANRLKARRANCRRMPLSMRTYTVQLWCMMGDAVCPDSPVPLSDSDVPS
eukprot:3007620-Prymnesium_polylepis.1